MVVVGKVDTELMAYAGVAIPFSLLGAVVGANMFLSISEKASQRAVLLLLIVSGCVIVVQSVL